ncbi:MAG: hypothetical protein SFX73_26085 [Kofleriaceae bacterium]|nr:hypothetical protein [Kofleriaceae bacterium]
MKLAIAFVQVATAASVAHAGPLIVDNSFYVEEAYNQEAGVVQHIQQLQLDPKTKAWAYLLTTEWPASDQLNQLSVSVPINHDPDGTGIGDVMINYRRELLRLPEDKVIVTPRFSLWLPTGDAAMARGAGVAGIQAQACVSFLPHSSIAFHSNLGVTAPLTTDASGDTAFLLGQSVIWFVHDRLNIMAEAAATVPAVDDADASRTLILSPGLRTALDFDSGLQIVPGAAVPLILEDDARSWGVLFYVSIEHPMPGMKKGS